MGVVRVAFLTLAAENGASPRARVYQFIPALESAGISCTVLPAVPTSVSHRFYGTGTRLGNLGYQSTELVRRAAQLLRLRRFDVVVVQKALLTVGLRGFDALAGAAARRLVVDVDDAVHLGPAHRLPGWMRPVEDVTQPARLIERAAHIVAGSRRLADELLELNSKVSVVPTSVDTERFFPAGRKYKRVPVIGWIGSPSTAAYLDTLAPVLRRLAGSRHFRLVLVGAAAPPPGVKAEVRRWDPQREIADLHEFDVGIMPMPDTPWTRGKCGYKALQYMAVGIPAVCSPAGAAPEIVRPGIDGLLPRTPDEWHDALAGLLADPGLGSSLGASGRARAEARYSVRANAPKLAAVLEEASQ